MALSAVAPSVADADPLADDLRPAIEGALRADAPALHLPDLPVDVALDPVNTLLESAPGRRLWGEPLIADVELSGDRLTLSIRARCAIGQLLNWPVDDPWLRLQRAPDGALQLDAGPDRLSARPPLDAPPPCRAAGWQTIAVRLHGPRGSIGLYLDGRPVASLPRAPFELPAGSTLGAGPAAGDVADLAAWPDALGADRLLDHALAAHGLRPPPVARRIELTARRDAHTPHFGCARFAPDGRWLVGCRSNGLVFVDGATRAQNGAHLDHLEPLTAVDIDPSGRFVATADGTSTALIWRAATQRPEARIELDHPIAGAAFAPDGRTLALWSPRDGPGRLTRLPFYDPDAEAETRSLPAPIHHVEWRADGGALAIALVDAPPHGSGRAGPTAALPLPTATAAAWHPTDDTLFVGTATGAVWRLDLRGPRTLRPAPARGQRPATERLPVIFGHTGDGPSSSWVINQRSTTFGRPPWVLPSDTRTIVDLAVDPGRVAIVTDSGAALMDHDGARYDELPHPVPATAVALARGLLLTGAADGAVRRFAATDGRALGTTADSRRDANGQPMPVRAIRPSPDGQRIAVGHLGVWKTRLLSLEAGPVDDPPPPLTPPGSRLAASPSGLQLLVAQYAGQLVGWDLDRMRRLVGFSTRSPATSLAWGADGPRTGHADGRIRHWTADGALIGSDDAHGASSIDTVSTGVMPSGGVDGLFVLADGTWISSGRRTIRHWRGRTLLATHRLPTPSLQISRPVLDGDERLIVSTITGLVRIDPRSGASEALIPPSGGIAGAPYAWIAAGGSAVAGVRFGPQGPRLTFWRERSDAPTDVALPMHAQRLVFSPDGQRLALAGAIRGPTGEWSFPILLFDPTTGSQTARIEGHRAAISAMRFEHGPAGDLRLHTGSWDGHRRTFTISRGGARLASRRPGCPAMALHSGPSRVALCTDRILVDRDAGRLTLIDDADGRWLITTDDGHFTASREGDRLAAAIAGPRRLGLDRLALNLNRPDLIAARFGLGGVALRADLERRVRRRAQRHGLTDAPPALTALPRVDLEPIRVLGESASIRASARSASGLTRWRIRADGTPVAEGPLRGRADHFEARLPLIDGRNLIEVDVADTAGRWSPRARAVVAHDDTRPPRLFVVAFGVSRYADPAIRDLRFAHRDALDLVARFEGHSDRWAEVITRVYTDEAVVPGAFAEAEALLARAEPRDTVIIFVSGHGLYDRGGVYRYLTHDAQLAAVEASLPFDRVEALLDATPARRRLMLLDTCQSGELFDAAGLAVPAPTAPGAMQARVIPRPVGQARLIRPIVAAPAPADDRRDRFVDRDLRRGRGAVVFSSSRGAEASWELESLSNGAFTEAVLEGLSGAADPDRDGRITLDELRAYVTAEVARLTGDRQHPTIDRENRAARIVLPLLDRP